MSYSQAEIQNAVNYSCESCDNETFKQVFVIKRISALVSKEGKDTFVPIPIFSCDICGHINEIFSKDLKINDKSSEKDSVSNIQL